VKDEILSAGTLASVKSETTRSVSKRKRKANRENAKKSTGPKTARGKRNSSFNAMKHGLLAKRIKIEDESDAARLRQLSVKLHARYGSDDDQDVRNDLLLEMVVVDYWRFSRGLDAETETCKYTPDWKPYLLPDVARYITANRKVLLKTLDLLEQTRLERVRQKSNLLKFPLKNSDDSEEFPRKQPKPVGSEPDVSIEGDRPA